MVVLTGLELDQEQQNEYQNEYACPCFLHEEITGFFFTLNTKRRL